MATQAPTRIITITPSNAGTSIDHRYQPIKLGLAGDATYGIVGSGGWQIVDRPKQVAATQWYDRSPFQMSFDGIFDHTVTAPLVYPTPTPSDAGFTPKRPSAGDRTVDPSVEPYCESLEYWLNRVPKKNRYEPPILKVSGPVPGTARLWVLYSFEFDAAVRNGAGQRTMQEVKIVLYEYNSPLSNQATHPTPAKKHAEQISTQAAEPNSTAGSDTTYTVSAGDTLLKISHAFYGGRDVVSNIMAQNGLRDPNSIVVGQVISLPVV